MHRAASGREARATLMIRELARSVEIAIRAASQEFILKPCW